MIQTLADIDDVERIIGHPSCFSPASDDTDVTPLEVTVAVLRDPNCILLKPHTDTLFLFKRVNQITYEMHVMIIKGPARKQGLASAVKVAEWLFRETPCLKIISYIPEFHLASLMYAKVCGLVEEGILKDAYLKDGKIYDLVVLGATKDRLEEIHKEI